MIRVVRAAAWALVPVVFVISAGGGHAAPADGIDVRSVPLEEAVTQGERAHAAIDAIEGHYQSEYFDRGHSIQDMKGTGYHPWWRLRHHYEQRQDHAGRYDPIRRWQLFEDVRAKTLRDGAYRRTAAWEPVGPEPFATGEGGRVLCLAFHPGDPTILYAGSSASGLWRSVDEGQSWSPMTDQLPSMRVSAFAIDPTDPDRMLIGTGTGYASTIALAPGVGVLQSSNGGLTWDFTSFAYAEAAGVSSYALEWDGLDPNRVFLAATNGVWRSLDRGATWEQVLSGDASDVVLDPVTLDVVYAALDGGGLFKSTDGGDTWTPLTSGLPAVSTIGRTSLTLCASQPLTLYASIGNSSTFALQGLYRTDDGGQSWSNIATAPDYLCSSTGSGCVAWLFNVISVAPHDPDLLLAGGVRFFRSINGGASWSWRDYTSNGIGDSNPGLIYVDNFAIAWHPTDATRVYAANDGGVWESTTSGHWWDPRNAGLATTLLYRIGVDAQDVDHVVGGSQDHGTVAVDNSGGNRVWTKWSYGDGGPVLIHSVSNQIVYGVLQFGNHIKSFNGGSAMVLPLYQINTGILESAPFIAETVMDPSNPNTLYHASNARIYKTTNGGELWSVVADLPNVRTLAVDHVDPGVVYAHAYDGSTWHLYRSVNGGGSWTEITDPSIPSWRVTDIETDPVTSGVVYATRNSAFPGNDHVKVSTDLGNTWTNITGDLPDVPTHGIAVSAHAPDQLYLATDLGVFATEDGGTTWQEWNDGLPVVYVNDIEYHTASGMVLIGTEGRSVWRSPAIPTVDVPSASPRPPFSVAEARPNPTQRGASVPLTLGRDAEVRAAVYNAMGQQVQRLEARRRRAGRHVLTWNGDDLRGRLVPPGTYFIRVEADGLAQARRVQVLR